MKTRPEVATKYGRVHAVYEREAEVFRGIRYRATTAGANRFRAPQPPNPWTGLFDAGKAGPQCPQLQISGTGALPTLTAVFGRTGDAAKSSEDCLYPYLGGPDSEQFGQSAVVGQLDLVQALEWVDDNIEAFGGDPRQVIVFGESGGGQKIAVPMAWRTTLRIGRANCGQAF